MHESRKIGEIAGQSERNGRRKSLLEECTATAQDKLRRRTMSKKEDERAERKAKKDLKEGKSPKTASGEFVHEEMEHYKEGKHGKSRKQAIAIGISKARRHGIPYPGRKLKPQQRKIQQQKRIAGEDQSRALRKSQAAGY